MEESIKLIVFGGAAQLEEQLQSTAEIIGDDVYAVVRSSHHSVLRCGFDQEVDQGEG